MRMLDREDLSQQQVHEPKPIDLNTQPKHNSLPSQHLNKLKCIYMTSVNKNIEEQMHSQNLMSNALR